MSESQFHAVDYALDALERQQAAARRRGHFPQQATGQLAPGSRGSREADSFLPEGAAENSPAEGLHWANLESSPWRNSPGIAKADLLSKHDAPKKLDTVVERMISTYGWKNRLAIAALSQHWAAVVGEANVAHCWVESFNERTGELLIGTQSQIWAAQFRLLLPTLHAEIAKFVGHGVVQKVVVLGPEATALRRQREE